MLNLGLIGEIELMEPYLKMIRHHPEVQISGKSSIGSNTGTGNLRFSIPEFNRLELIERSDALLVNRFSLLPFPLLSAIVKKAKPVFAAEFPVLSIEECQELVKFAAEAKTNFQVINPFYSLAPVRWMEANLKKPAFLDIFYFQPAGQHADSLLSLLLMLKIAGSVNPKKINALSFGSPGSEDHFNNLRLEMVEASAVNINFGSTGSLKAFTIMGWSAGQRYLFDIENGEYSVNGSPLDFSETPQQNEFEEFVDCALGRYRKTTGLEDYLTALENHQKTEAKLAQFSSF